MQITNPATGAYTVTLLDNVCMPPARTTRTTDPTTSLTYSITDADGSTANGTLTITFDDDAPTATNEASQNVAEGATVTGTLDFVAGADGASVTHINGTALVFNPGDSNYSQAIDIGAGSIKVKADGTLLVHGGQPGDWTGLCVGDVHGDGRRRRHGDGRRSASRSRMPTRRAAAAAAAAVDDDGLRRRQPGEHYWRSQRQHRRQCRRHQRGDVHGQLGVSVGR